MAKITRKTQKVFAGSVTATGNIAVFGSLAAGSPAYSNDPDAIQTTAYQTGWQSATVGNNSPALQDDNALNFLFSRQLAYLFQAGIPEYDAATEFHQFSLCQSGGNVYQSITNTNIGNPVSNTNHWLLILRPTTARGASVAFVNFDGTGANSTNQTIRSAFNVSSVFKNAAGNYTVNFASPLANANYVCTGNARDTNNSDTVPIVGPFLSDTKTTSAFQVRTRIPSTGAAVNSSEVCLVFFVA